MLTPEELRAAIYCRAQVATQGGAYLSNHVLGQVRGLLFALLGEPPPSIQLTHQVLDLAGIPYADKGSTLEVPDEWLEAHGFDYQGRHPRFSKPW